MPTPARTAPSVAATASLARSPGPGAPLAFVHGLYPGDRDGPTLLDQLRGQLLWRGQVGGPRVAAGEQCRCGADGELGRGDPVQLVPGHRERHRYPGPD